MTEARENAPDLSGWAEGNPPSAWLRAGTGAVALLVLTATGAGVLWPLFDPPAEPKISLEDAQETLRQTGIDIPKSIESKGPEVQWSYVVFQSRLVGLLLGAVETGWRFNAGNEGEFPDRQWCQLVTVSRDGTRKSVTLGEKEADQDIAWRELNRTPFQDTFIDSYLEQTSDDEITGLCGFAETEEDVRAVREKDQTNVP